MIRPLLLALGAAGLAAAALPTLYQDVTLDRLPEPYEVLARKVLKSPVKLSDAVATAEQEVGGVAREAKLLLDQRGAEVHVYTASESWRVVIREDGAVLKKTQEAPWSLPGWPVSGEPTTTDSGLAYYDLEPGSGASPASRTARVRVHYSGYLLDGTKFDSSVDRGTAAVFTLDTVITGWTEGIASMKVGGKRKLVVPAKLAYGDAGRQPKIPPRAILVFDVELLGLM